ncbi:MAG: hypothetical protein WC052_06190 [Patescibacteria group bacterium]
MGDLRHDATITIDDLKKKITELEKKLKKEKKKRKEAEAASLHWMAQYYQAIRMRMPR